MSDRTGNEVSTYVDKAMFQAEPMEVKGPTVTLLSATNDPLGAIAAACKMYEGKVVRDMSELTDRERLHYWEQVQKTHLKAPLEFVDLHFLVEGVTRSFTHQMVRQRTAVFAQESMRFAVKDNMVEETPYPPSLQGAGDGSKARHQRMIWDEAVEKIQDVYNELIQNGVPAEDARGLLPHQTTTRLHYKTNLRNLLDHAGNRLCTQAQFEWRMVFLSLVKAISENEGHQKTDQKKAGTAGSLFVSVSDRWQWEHIAKSNVFKPVCFEVGKCPFAASFDRGCTIRERVDAGKFDEIKVSEYMLDPRAAWVS